MKVIQTIKSTHIGEYEPVDVTYYTGDDHAQALAALVTAAAAQSDHYLVLEVRIEF